jgi:hypothetical protein
VPTVCVAWLDAGCPERVLERCDAHGVCEDGLLAYLPLVTAGTVVATHTSLQATGFVKVITKKIQTFPDPCQKVPRPKVAGMFDDKRLQGSKAERKMTIHCLLECYHHGSDRDQERT